MTTPNSKWYDRVRAHTITRIEETLNDLKALHVSEGDATTPEELDGILAQQIDTIHNLQTHTQALATSTTTRRNIHTESTGGDPQKTYTYRYTANTEK